MNKALSLGAIAALFAVSSTFPAQQADRPRFDSVVVTIARGDVTPEPGMIATTSLTDEEMAVLIRLYPGLRPHINTVAS